MTILKRKEVADMYRVPLRTVDYWASTGQIPFSRLGKRAVRFDRDTLDKWFKDREGVEFRQQKN